MARLHALSQQQHHHHHQQSNQQSQHQSLALQGQQESQFAPVHNTSLAHVPTATSVTRGLTKGQMNLSEERADHRLQHEQSITTEKIRSQKSLDVCLPKKPSSRPQAQVQQRRTNALVFACNCSNLTRLVLLSVAISAVILYVYC